MGHVTALVTQVSDRIERIRAVVDELQRRSIPIVIFVPAGTAPALVPDEWHARYLGEATAH